MEEDDSRPNKKPTAAITKPPAPPKIPGTFRIGPDYSKIYGGRMQNYVGLEREGRLRGKPYTLDTFVTKYFEHTPICLQLMEERHTFRKIERTTPKLSSTGTSTSEVHSQK